MKLVGRTAALGREKPAAQATPRLERLRAIDPQLLRLHPDCRLLDLGCGTGRHTLEICRQDCEIVAADLSRVDLLKARYLLGIMRRRAEARARVHFALADGFYLPFASGRFDRIICTETLEHVQDDAALIGEMVRVLRPGGLLAVSVPDFYTESLLWRLSPRYRSIPGGHVRVYTRRRIRELLRCGGLRPYAVRYRHSLESLYWLVAAFSGGDLARPAALVRSLRGFLDSATSRGSKLIDWIDRVGNNLLPKSIVVYARKPLKANP